MPDSYEGKLYSKLLFLFKDFYFLLQDVSGSKLLPDIRKQYDIVFIHILYFFLLI